LNDNTVTRKPGSIPAAVSPQGWSSLPFLRGRM